MEISILYYLELLFNYRQFWEDLLNVLWERGGGTVKVVKVASQSLYWEKEEGRWYTGRHSSATKIPMVHCLGLSYLQPESPTQTEQGDVWVWIHIASDRWLYPNQVTIWTASRRRRSLDAVVLHLYLKNLRRIVYWSEDGQAQAGRCVCV